ncbi:MAG: ATP-binding protein [Microgenomates group bacterium]
MEVADKIKIKGGLMGVLLILSTVALLAGSVFVWSYVNRSVDDQRKDEFLGVVEMTEERIQDTLSMLVERLYDLRGFVSIGEINSERWASYLTSTEIESRHPGLYTFAYAPVVERGELESFLSNVKNEEKGAEYRQYSVFPETETAEVVPIRYLYTRDPDIGSLLGYDITTSENQVVALKKAVADDAPVITNLLHIGLVIPGNAKTGYVIMLPVYNKIDIVNYSKEERRQYFTGLVGTWVFPQGLLSHVDIEEALMAKGVSLTVFDGEDKSISLGSNNGGDLRTVREINLLDKTFKFEFVGKRQKILDKFTESLPWLTLWGLIIINLMWIATVTSILLSRREAKKLAAEATKDLRKFKQAVEGVSDMVTITDENGVIIYVNGMAEKITGYKKEVMLGKTPRLWGRQMDEEFYKKFWETIKEDKKPFWGEVTNKRKNGELYEAEVNISPILDDSGKLLFFVSIERDLTKTKAIERVKKEFISLASHQLRTPLSAVKWFGKMLISGDAGDLNPVQKEYVEKIYESNEREIRLVNSILNVSRIESGKILIEPRSTDLTKLVSSVVTDFKLEVEELGKKLTAVIDKKIPKIYIDEDQMRHVYANLISNAIRYTNKRGKIVVKVYLSKKSVVTEVKDNGIGIPKGEQKGVFEKFFRASNALKVETDGTGLGLFLSKIIVESSGGKMGFRSREGKGSTFWFTLPIRTKK